MPIEFPEVGIGDLELSANIAFFLYFGSLAVLITRWRPSYVRRIFRCISESAVQKPSAIVRPNRAAARSQTELMVSVSSADFSSIMDRRLSSATRVSG